MKKILFAVVLVTLMTFSAQAQIRFGAKGGITSSDVSGSVDTKSITGFSVGPTVEVLINQRFGAQASVMFSQKGINFKGQDNQKTSYIEVPVSLKVAIPVLETIKPFINAGPYVGFKIAGDKNFNSITNEVSQQWKAKSFVAGLNFGAGVEFLSFIQIGVNYGLGLTDNYKVSDGSYSVKDRTWSLTAGVYF